MASEAAEKVKIAVIPRSAATRNPSFAGIQTRRDPSTAAADSGRRRLCFFRKLFNRAEHCTSDRGFNPLGLSG